MRDIPKIGSEYKPKHDQVNLNKQKHLCITYKPSVDYKRTLWMTFINVN